VEEIRGEWSRVRLGADILGWIPSNEIAHSWLKVWKRERKLFEMKDDVIVRSFRIALGGNNPVGNKVKRGDGATPEGRYFIAELDGAPEAKRYGARSMRLSYPSVSDARRGLRDHLIDKAAYIAIVRAARAGEIPPQHTALGGSIRIHGGGSAKDWTLGCIALDDPDVTSLYEAVYKGMRVDVYASAAEDQRPSS
jgi:murein L,D-transpeptidase YafK